MRIWEVLIFKLAKIYPDYASTLDRHSASNYFIKPDGSGLWGGLFIIHHTLTLARGVRAVLGGWVGLPLGN